MKKKFIIGVILLIAIIIISLQYMFTYISTKTNQKVLPDNSTNINNNTKTINTLRPTLYHSIDEIFSSNNTEQWHNVSGQWSLTNKGLHGGTNNNKTSSVDNILISPVASKAPSIIITSFQVNNLDPNESNSVSIIYSAHGSKDYRQAGIFIYKNDVYARFADINNGTLSSPNPWPGIKTGIKYVPGSVFNMSLALQNNSQSISINGSEYPYNGNNTNTDGYVGLKYGKIKDIDFHNFKVIENSILNNTFTNYEFKNISSNIISSNLLNASNAISSNHIVSDSQTISLEDKHLPKGSYIHLYDSTPYKIITGHVAAKLPCNDTNQTTVNVLTGQAPNLKPTELEFIAPLSTSGDLCLYHANIASTNKDNITDIAIQNNSTDNIRFPSTSTVVLQVTEIAPLDENTHSK